MYDAEIAEVSGLDLEEVLPDDLAAELLARAERRKVEKGQTLIEQGDDSSYVYLIVSGLVRFSVASSNGKEIVLREMGPGRLFGEMAVLGDHRRSARATVVTSSVIGRISGTAFTSFLKEVPGAGHWLATLLAARVRHLTEKCSELATLSVCARIHMEIMRIAVTAAQDSDHLEINNFPTHEELAKRIGSHREAVTRELRQLDREGFISQSRRTNQSGSTLTIHSLSRMRTLMARLTR